jgi:hypothetical protein
MSNQNNERPALGAHEDIIITPEKRSAAGEPAEDGYIPPTEPKTSPAQPGDDPEDEKPLHLDFPAPTFEQIGERISKWGMRLPGFSAEWQTRGETQCIRCKIMAVSRTITVNIPGIIGTGATAEFTVSRATEYIPCVHADLEVGG